MHLRTRDIHRPRQMRLRTRQANRRTRQMHLRARDIAPPAAAPSAAADSRQGASRLLARARSGGPRATRWAGPWGLRRWSATQPASGSGGPPRRTRPAAALAGMAMSSGSGSRRLLLLPGQPAARNGAAGRVRSPRRSRARGRPYGRPTCWRPGSPPACRRSSAASEPRLGSPRVRSLARWKPTA